MIWLGIVIGGAGLVVTVTLLVCIVRIYRHRMDFPGVLDHQLMTLIVCAWISALMTGSGMLVWSAPEGALRAEYVVAVALLLIISVVWQPVGDLEKFSGNARKLHRDAQFAYPYTGSPE